MREKVDNHSHHKKRFIKEGILKLFLERKIDLNQMQRMKDMIDSEDPENERDLMEITLCRKYFCLRTV